MLPRLRRASPKGYLTVLAANCISCGGTTSPIRSLQSPPPPLREGERPLAVVESGSSLLHLNQPRFVRQNDRACSGPLARLITCCVSRTRDIYLSTAFMLDCREHTRHAPHLSPSVIGGWRNNTTETSESNYLERVA
jgi:hypothetical protein